jgi:hypothetical protein
MRKFDETMKYLSALWESIFNPQLSMGSDFAESYNNINERLEALANLDYGKLTEESLDPSIKTYLSQDKILKRNPQVLTQSGWKCIFENDFTIIKQSYQILLTKFKEGAIKLEQSGKWSKQESLHYRTALSMFLEILEVKYHDFRDLHKDLISDKIPNEGYTVMQWAIVLYYINAEKYPDITTDREKIRQFMKDFKIAKKTESNLRNKYSMIKNIFDDRRSSITEKMLQDAKTVLPKIKEINKTSYNEAKNDLIMLQE